MNEYIYEAELARQELAKGKRLSKRGLFDTREISIELNTLQNADGSCILSLGKTKVIAGIKLLPEKPFPDTPDEGSISVNVELSPMSDPNFDTGPPDEVSIELSRVVDRALRESKGIDWKKLCIKEGKFVWMIYVDIYIMNNDGNLFDACEYASLIAIKNARVPKIEVNEETCEIIKGEYTNEKIDFTNDPLLFTFAKIRDKIILDPDLIEEAAQDARFSVAIVKDKKLVAIQKGAEGVFKVDEIKDMVNIAIKSYNTMHDKLLASVK